MSFEPEPGLQIQLDKNEFIEFLSLENSRPASVFVYAESGKEGTVYKVLKNKELYALKVFYPEYRDKRLLENTEKLNRFKTLEGFRVAERNLLEPEEYPELIQKYPDLAYSVLMPWIEGTVWGNLMLESNINLGKENCFQIAKTLIRVVGNLESQGLAHCDLSNNNFIIANGFSEIELIDIEDMYAPDMPRPIPDVSYGTIGYRTPWIAEKGLWGPESDRFATAILCSEILTWHKEEIRGIRSGNASYFEEEEIGQESDRYKRMIRYLDEQNNILPALFEKAWFASDFSHCPLVSEWYEAIHKLEKPLVKIESEVIQSITLLEEISSIVEQEPPKANSESGLTISRGVPPKLEIDIEILDFGIISNDADNSRQFTITNTGGSILKVNIQAEGWIDLSFREFALGPKEQSSVVVSMNKIFPKPARGREYRSPLALTIESNASNAVIGARYVLPKASFRYLRWLYAFFGFILRPFSRKHKKDIEESTIAQPQSARKHEDFPDKVSVYVVANNGTPIYHSLPSSNNWTVWLEKGAKVSLTKVQKDYASIGIYGHYVEIVDKNGNEGFVAANQVSLKQFKETPAALDDTTEK